MYIVTGKSCSSWYATAYTDENENERILRVIYVDEALQAAWMDAPMASDLEKRIERKGENFALQQLLDEMVERKQISVADALAEMAKFMGGETEAPPEPEPEKPKLAYAVGDEILVKGVIVMVDEDDETYPYHVRINNFSKWVEVEDIAGKASPVADVKEEPKPEPKFKVGDKVIHKFKPVWGVGEVLEIHQRTAQYDFFGGDYPEAMPATRAYKVRYSHMAADGYYDHWNTAEENLFAA